MMNIAKRTHDTAFFPCPICYKRPYVHVENDGLAYAYCCGHGFHRHKKVFTGYCTNVATQGNTDVRQKTVEILARKWNQIGLRRADMLFDKEETVKRLTGVDIEKIIVDEVYKAD